MELYNTLIHHNILYFISLNLENKTNK